MSFQDISEILRRWPEVPAPSKPFADEPCERLRSALRGLESGKLVGPADLASLIRGAIRREAARFDSHPRLTLPAAPPWPDKGTWRLHGCSVSDTAQPGFCTVEANEWQSDWLSGGGLVSSPFLAAEAAAPSRRQNHPVPADPALKERFKRQTYLSQSQADAVRAVALAVPGAVMTVALPTGSGKSLVGLCAAALGASEGLSVVVVPTIALAYDQVVQARQALPTAAVDAWHADLKPGDRDAIRQRIRSGQQRIIYAAPESVTHALAGPLYAAAKHGFLRAFVIDEAHLVAQWGHGFRPEFQAMSGLWMALRRTCPEGKAFKTVLMTATLTEESERTLQTFFGQEDEIEVLASVHLRPEPDYFVAECRGAVDPDGSVEQQDERVLEVLRQGPRPAILYVTERAQATRWHARLRALGWQRIGCIHGGTSGADREAAIAHWRENEIDLMVATSAFGLGMDKGDVRLVVHACVPETVDRYYQEVGRGGRDGFASVSVLLWTRRDLGISEGMSGPKIIGDELGTERWNAVRHSSGWDGEVMLANLRALRPGIVWDSDANIGWNMKALLLLARAGALTIESRPPPDVERLKGESDANYEARIQAAMETHWSLCPVRVHAGADLSTSAYWERVISPKREQTLAAARTDWERMKRVLSHVGEIGGILRKVYRVPEAGIEVCEGSEGLPVQPPRRLLANLAESLHHAVAGKQLLALTYPVNRDWKRTILDAIKLLVDLGIREVAVPPNWLATGVLDKVHTNAPERFVLVRGIAEAEPAGSNGWPLPRLSVMIPADAPFSLPESLLLLERPLHLILTPVGTLDGRHPGRKLGDVQPPETMRWDTLESLLQL